jgi:hypothetical protein
MHEAMQMTTGQPVGAASHTTGRFSAAVRIGSKSVSSRSDSFCTGARPRFHGGVLGWSSRMNGKPSSPVLRRPGASNGARLLDNSHRPPIRPRSYSYAKFLPTLGSVPGSGPTLCYDSHPMVGFAVPTRIARPVAAGLGHVERAVGRQTPCDPAVLRERSREAGVF